MLIINQSEQEICVGETLQGPPAHKAMMMKPGDKLAVDNVMPQLSVVFVTTPDGLRIAFIEDKNDSIWVPNGKVK